MNIIDKAIATVNPRAAVRRSVARQKLNIINSGYGNHGASTSKKSMVSWEHDSGSPDEDIHENIEVLRQRSRDLAYGTPIATSAYKTSRTNVIGSGLRVKPKVNRKILNLSDQAAHEWETKTQQEFALWAESNHCDAQRMNNFYELQQLAFTCWSINGETFALLPMIERQQLPYDLRVMLIEPDRVKTPEGSKDNVKYGVEIGKYGEVIAYYVANEFPSSDNLGIKYKRIEKYGKRSGRANIIHLMVNERVGQYRGIPEIAPVIEYLKQISRYTSAEITSAVIGAYFTVFIENKSTDSVGAFGSAQDYDYNSSQAEVEDDDYEPANLKLGEGSIIELDEGQTIKEANPGRPHSGFDAFIKAMSIQIGAALEIPSDVLLKNYDKSYSAARASMLDAWKTFKMKRDWMVNDFCQPIYEEFLTEGVVKGRINAPGFLENPIIRKAYCSAEWNGPAPGQIDPLKEVNASIKKVENGFSTREQETIGLTGGDFKSNIEAAKVETQMMKDSGLKEDVSAKEVLGSKK